MQPDQPPPPPTDRRSATRPPDRGVPLTAEDREFLMRVSLEATGRRRGWRAAARRLWRKHVLVAAASLYGLLKRAIDVAAAAVGLVLFAPLGLLIAAAIKLTDRGPVLFWQKRVGKWGREFDFPKFRSMCVDAEAKKAALLAENDHKEGLTFKMRRDPRVTAVGRVLRRLSLDEMPQLWCVLKGDMAIVGPRPPVPSEVARYTLADRRRLDAVPGLTCFWQVGGRGTIPFAEQVEMDVEYIERRSTGTDLWVMLKTIPAVLSGRGAY